MAPRNNRLRPARTVESIVRALKLNKPHNIAAVLEDGSERPITLSGERQRYSRAARSLLALNATMFHCYDAEKNLTETIALAEDEDELSEVAAKNNRERTRDMEVAALLKVVVDAQDRGMGRFVEILEAQRAMSEGMAGAAIKVMEAASERAAKLESLVMRLTVARESELFTRERELIRLQKQLEREANAVVEAGEKSEEAPLIPPEIERLIKVAEDYVAMGKEKPAPEPEAATDEKH